MRKVTVGVILFGTKYLKESLPSLVNQDYGEVEFVFRDQEEGVWSAYAFVQKELPEIFEKVTITRDQNVFHSGGHNVMMREMESDYYFCCSNDMLYSRDFVSRMVAAMEGNPEFGAATCKLLRWDYGGQGETKVIDSMGIGVKKYHHFFDIGQGRRDRGQLDGLKEVFGVSGALAVFRRRALDLVKYRGEYFDELLHYKNDVDLSYRLRWAGQRCMVVPEVVVYHDRQVGKGVKKSLWAKRSSFLGEKILMRKNFDERYPLLLRWQTWIYQWMKTAYLLATTPQLFKELRELRRLKTEIRDKRNAMRKLVYPEAIMKLMDGI